jgi:hypothetical protein
MKATLGMSFHHSCNEQNGRLWASEVESQPKIPVEGEHAPRQASEDAEAHW